MKERIAVISVVSNLAIAISKLIIGILSKSTSVVADGIHSITDSISSVIALIGIKAAKKPPDREHPYGHYKFEVLSGLFIAVILFLTGLSIMYESYKSFLKPHNIKFQNLSMVIMGASAILNEVMSRLKIHFGKKENSVSLILDGVHSKVDVYTSIAVFVGIILDRYWIYADASLAMLIGIYILKESITLGKETTDSLLDSSAGEEVENKIKTIISEENVRIIDIKTQKRGPVISANIKVSLPKNISLKRVSRITDLIKDKLNKNIENLEYISIQVQGEESNHKKICYCPSCGFEMEHKPSIPCSSLKCPNCNTTLKRKI